MACLNNEKISVIDLDPHWIRIQELCGSGSVSRLQIRIHTGQNEINKRQKCKVEDKNSPFRDPTDQKNVKIFWRQYFLVVFWKDLL